MIDQAEFKGFPATQREIADHSTIERFLRLSDEKGPLVPRACVAGVLGVSTARAYQFLSEGRLQVIEFGNTVFVSAVELQEFKQQARRNGRPKKDDGKD
jgi:hypothetical protein